MAAANNEFFEALSMLEHERGITAEYLIEKIKAAIVIAVKKNYEVEDDNVVVEIDPDTGQVQRRRCIQDRRGDEVDDPAHRDRLWRRPSSNRKSFKAGDESSSPSRPRTSAASPRRPQSTSSARASRRPSAARCTPRCSARAHEIVSATVTNVDPEKGIVAAGAGQGRRGHAAPQRAGPRRGLRRGPACCRCMWWMSWRPSAARA